MPSLQDELNSLVNTIQNNATNQVLINPLTDQPIPVEATQVAAPAPVTEAPKVEAPVVVPVAAKKVDLSAVADDWDSESPVEVTVPEVQVPTGFDFSEVAKALGNEEIKSKEDLFRIVNDYKTKAEEVKTLPEDLIKASEIARLGGDYLEYLQVATVKWEDEDPISLYENYVTDQFADPRGAIDFDKVDKILESMTDDQKELEGRKLQRQYVNLQKQQKSNIEAQARYNRQQFEANVKSVLDRLDNIGGYKVTQAHRAELFNDIITGKDLERNNLQERVLRAFKSKNFDKIDSYRKQQIKNATLTEILNEAQVPEIRPSTEVVPAVAPTAYGMGDWIKELEQRRR